MGIENINAIDILAVKKDNRGVELIIIASGYLDASRETQTKLLDKVQNYLGYINSLEFINEVGKFKKEEIKIVLQCYEEPDPIIKELADKINVWVNENGACFELNINK